MNARYSLVLALLLLCASAGAAEAVPTAISFTTYLRESGGQPPAAVPSAIEVELYDSVTGGQVVASDIGGIGYVDGLLQVTLENVEAGSLPQGLWVEVTIDGETFDPRQRVLSVPYCLTAADADQLGGVDADLYVKRSPAGIVATNGPLVVEQYELMRGPLADRLEYVDARKLSASANEAKVQVRILPTSSLGSSGALLRVSLVRSRTGAVGPSGTDIEMGEYLLAVRDASAAADRRVFQHLLETGGLATSGKPTAAYSTAAGAGITLLLPRGDFDEAWLTWRIVVITPQAASGWTYTAETLP